MHLLKAFFLIKNLRRIVLIIYKTYIIGRIGKNAINSEMRNSSIRFQLYNNIFRTSVKAKEQLICFHVGIVYLNAAYFKILCKEAKRHNI